MKAKIHPHYKEIEVTCSCGNTFSTRSTSERKQLLIEICSMCHPFYTGMQKLTDTGGRVDKFRQKYTQKPTPEAKAQGSSTKEAKVKKKAAPKAKVSRKIKAVTKPKVKKEKPSTATAKKKSAPPKKKADKST